MKAYKILAVNPGSTSTKIAIFKNSKLVFDTTLKHSTEELSSFMKIYDQYSYRKSMILDALEKSEIKLSDFDCIVGRGGLLKPICSGTYEISDEMLVDLKEGKHGEHASNLGGILAYDIAKVLDIKSFVVDPVVVDEMSDLARISGVPWIDRVSIFHALNQKAVARRVAKDLNKYYEDLNLVVAHMGGGISVGAHEKGKVVDVNNALDGDGPFSPERSGGLPVGNLMKLCYSGAYSLQDMSNLINGKGGLVAYLGTNDGQEVFDMIEAGNGEAELIMRAMAYQIAKEIGKAAAVLKGSVDAIVLTGGLAYSKRFILWIEEYISFIGQVYIYPGENEMQALADGALRVLIGEEKVKKY